MAGDRERNGANFPAGIKVRAIAHMIKSVAKCLTERAEAQNRRKRSKDGSTDGCIGGQKVFDSLGNLMRVLEQYSKSDAIGNPEINTCLEAMEDIQIMKLGHTVQKKYIEVSSRKQKPGPNSK